MVRFLPLLVLAAAAIVGCHSPDEVLDDVNAIVFVFDVDDDERAVIDVDGQSRRSKLRENDVVQFQLVLTPGTHTGSITVVRVKGAGGGGDDEEESRDEEEREERDRCGTFDINVVDGEVASVGVLADELPRCDGGEGEPDGEGEGEGDDDDDDEVGEGEGEDDDPDGEGEGEGEGGDDGPDGEGEGESGDDDPDGGEGE